jgi:hypothetical protein
MQRLDNHIELKSGDPVARNPADLVMEIMHVLEDIDVVGGHIDKPPGLGGYGWKIHFDNGAESDYVKPFDFIGVSDVTYRITAKWAEAGAVWVAGTLEDSIGIGGDTGDPKLTRDTGDTVTDTHWTSGALDTVTGPTKQAVWLEIERGDTAGDTSNATTIWTDSAFPDGSDTKYERTEIIPLWYLPWDSTNKIIDISNVADLRDAYRLPAMV